MPVGPGRQCGDRHRPGVEDAVVRGRGPSSDVTGAQARRDCPRRHGRPKRAGNDGLDDSVDVTEARNTLPSGYANTHAYGASVSHSSSDVVGMLQMGCRAHP